MEVEVSFQKSFTMSCLCQELYEMSGFTEKFHVNQPSTFYGVKGMRYKGVMFKNNLLEIVWGLWSIQKSIVSNPNRVGFNSDTNVFC